MNTSSRPDASLPTRTRTRRRGDSDAKIILRRSKPTSFLRTAIVAVCVALAALAERQVRAFSPQSVSPTSRPSDALPGRSSYASPGRSGVNAVHGRLVPTPFVVSLTSSSTIAPRRRAGGGYLSSARGLSAQDEVILREFEKKEALLRKRREEALNKLNEYESTLSSLKSKKAEYMAAAQLAKPPLGGTFSETTIRSVVKSFLWRVVAGSVTFVTSYQFSGSLSTAFQLVGADFFSKAFTMFAGERLMNKSKAGRATGSDNVGRSVAKALLWRLFAICNTLGFALFISKDLSVAGKIASTDAVFKTGLMFAYERVWARIQWGKEYLLEYSI